MDFASVQLLRSHNFFLAKDRQTEKLLASETWDEQQYSYMVQKRLRLWVSWYSNLLTKNIKFTHIHIGIGSISAVQIQYWLQIVTKVNHP